MLQNPEYLAAGIMILLPILLHGGRFLRAREYQFAPLLFLFDRYSSKFMKLRNSNRLLVLLRTAMLVALVGLFAAPMIRHKLLVAEPAREGTGLIVLVDDSILSTAAGPSGSLLEQSKTHFETLVQDAEFERYSILSACGAFGLAWLDEAEALSVFAGLESKGVACHLDDLILDSIESGFSDQIQVFGRPSAELLADIPERIKLRVEAGELGGTGGNTAILDAWIAGTGEAVLVLESSGLSGGKGTIELVCQADRSVKTDASFDRSGVTSIELELPLPCAAGIWTAKLPEDSIRLDNQVDLVQKRARVVNVLLSDGVRGGRLLSRSDRFLESSLRGLNKLGKQFRIFRVGQEGLDSRLIDSVDMVILSDPHRLRGSIRDGISRAVKGGAILIVTAGENLKSQGEIKGLISGFWKVEKLLEPTGLVSAGSSTDSDRLATVMDASGPIEMSARLLFSSSGPARADSFIEFDDGMPAISTWRSGKGRVFFWHVSADLSMGNLPLHPAFPVIMGMIMDEVSLELPAQEPVVQCILGEPCEIRDYDPGVVLARLGGEEEARISSFVRGVAEGKPGVWYLKEGHGNEPVLNLQLSGAARRAGPTLQRQGELPAVKSGNRAFTGSTDRTVLSPVRWWFVLALALLLVFDGLTTLRTLLQ